MKVVLIAMLGLIACGVEAPSPRTEPSPVPGITEMTSSELSALSSQATTASCSYYWTCRDCPSGEAQNIVVRECGDGIPVVVGERACGEQCF